MEISEDWETGKVYLGSTVMVLDDSMDGTTDVLSWQRYLPFGEGEEGFTDLGYTGQRNYTDFGLMDYRARFYNLYLPKVVLPGVQVYELSCSTEFSSP